jgi:hypothetical protein
MSELNKNVIGISVPRRSDLAVKIALALREQLYGRCVGHECH